MPEAPDEPQRPEQPPALDGAGLDPEDAPLELDAEGFLVESPRTWSFPIDLDAWAWWAGVVVVAVIAFETLGDLLAGTLEGWIAGAGNVPVPRPDGYYSFVLLGGVLLLVLRRPTGAAPGLVRWVRMAACLAAGTAGALVIAQAAGSIALIFGLEGGTAGEPGAYAASNAVAGIGTCADVVTSAFAAALAVLLYRWSRLESEPAGDGEPEEPEEPEEAEVHRPAPVRRALGSLLLGALVSVACLVAFHVGVTRQQNGLVSPPPVSTQVSPSPGSGILIALGPSDLCTFYAAGSSVCGWGTATPSPSSGS